MYSNLQNNGDINDATSAHLIRLGGLA